MSYPPPYPPGAPPSWPPATPPSGHGPPPWPHATGYWAPGPWGAPPPPTGRRRWDGKTVALLVGGGVVVVAILVVVVVAGLSAGRSGSPALASAVAVTTAPPSDPTGLGEDPGLDGYAQRCHDGLMSACDDLYQLSEPMSRYEQYAVTCGGRVRAASVAICTDLDDGD